MINTVMYNPVFMDNVTGHEAGHGMGLFHSLVYSPDPDDGGSIMSYGAAVSLHPDDAATLSRVYPDAETFEDLYAPIRGEAFHGVREEPLIGGHVFARSASTGRMVVGAQTGNFTFVDGVLAPQPEFGCGYALTPGNLVGTGAFELVVPRGDEFEVGIEASDGAPMYTGGIPEQAGNDLGQQDFEEEGYNGTDEGSRETDAGAVVAVPAGTEEVTIVTNRTYDWAAFPEVNAVWCCDPPGTIYASAFPLADLLEADPAGDLIILGATFETVTGRPLGSIAGAPQFAEALVTLGTVHPSERQALPDLGNPLFVNPNWVGQDNDSAPLFFPDAETLTDIVRERAQVDPDLHLFVIVRLPDAFPYAPAPHLVQWPAFAGFIFNHYEIRNLAPSLRYAPHGDLGAEISSSVGPALNPLGRSYLSLDGGATFQRAQIPADPSFEINFGWAPFPPLDIDYGMRLIFGERP